MLGNLLRKFGVVLGMLCLLVPLSGGTASAASAYYSAPGVPWTASMNVCIGGELCGKDDTVTVDVPPSSYITYVRVYAHDNVGQKTGARLHLYVDGVHRGDLDVRSAGSYLRFSVYAEGSRLVFRSTNTDGSSAGDETVLQEILVSNACGCGGGGGGIDPYMA